jgi:hypothetical protein
MTKLPVSVTDDNDVPLLQEILDRFGLNYKLEPEENSYIFSET